jgi:polar amino acid transport system permease protein
VYNRTFEIIPMLMVAVIWYLFITSILNVGQSAIERYYARGTTRTVVNKRRAATNHHAPAAAQRLKEDV